MNFENAHALLIGVGGDLPITVKDATSIAEVLGDPQRAAYPSENIVLLTKEQATKKNVIEALEKLVLKTATLEDATVVVYYSGHGGKYGGNDGADYYLLTHGFDSYNRDDTMVNGNEFSTLINSIKAKKLLVMLDCCHAAGIVAEKSLIKLKSADEKITNSNIGILEKLNSGEGKVFITSCDDDEQSVILPDAQNSLFTEIVLEALEGQASNNENYVRMIDVLYHVLTQVPQRIKKYNHIQRPIINKIDFLTPDYFICRRSKTVVSGTKGIPKNTSVPQDELKNLIDQHNLQNSHKLIPLEELSNGERVITNTEIQKDVLEEIELFIVKGNTEKAIEKFVMASIDHFDEYRTESHLVANRYNTLIHEKMIGLIDDGTYRKELTKITYALQYFTKKTKQNIA